MTIDCQTCPPTVAPTLSPTPSPTPAPTDPCYSSWDLLRSDIISTNPRGGTFYICPDTTLSVGTSSGIPIQSQARIIVNCGWQGTKDDNCTIARGRYHFLVSSSGKLQVNGMTMRDATVTSIRSRGTASSTEQGIFNDCVWENNKNTENAGGDRYGDGLASVLSLYRGDAFVFDHCNFTGNEAGHGTVFSDRGKVRFNACRFTDNFSWDDIWGSCIVGSYYAEVSIRSCCFENNIANGWGTVCIRNDASLINIDNFGQGNIVAVQDGCLDIMHRSDPCEFFSASSCQIQN